MKKISVILPIYNVEQYLSQCIESFISTLPADSEVILVNDGSTDGSLSICEQYRDQYPSIVHIVNKPNGGLSDARNAGTEVAEGEWIYYLDSDDWVASGAIQKLYDFAIANQCDVVQGGFYYAYEQYLLNDNCWFATTDSPFVIDRAEAMRQLVLNQYVKNFAWGKLYRASIVKKYQFPKGKYFEDTYWQHLVFHDMTRYGVMPEPMYFYRQRETGISGLSSVRNLDLLRGYETRIAFLRDNYPNLVPEMKRLFCKHASLHTGIALQNGNDEVANAYLSYLRSKGMPSSRAYYRCWYFIYRVWKRLFPDHQQRIDL